MCLAPRIVELGARIVQAQRAPKAANTATVAAAIKASVLALTLNSKIDRKDTVVSDGSDCAVTGGRATVETISSHRPPV